jgi:hypothetical protein
MNFFGKGSVILSLYYFSKMPIRFEGEGKERAFWREAGRRGKWKSRTGPSGGCHVARSEFPGV